MFKKNIQKNISNLAMKKYFSTYDVAIIGGGPAGKLLKITIFNFIQ